ncbi:porimin [Rhinophrynus dorsalis]
MRLTGDVWAWLGIAFLVLLAASCTNAGENSTESSQSTVSPANGTAINSTTNSNTSVINSTTTAPIIKSNVTSSIITSPQTTNATKTSPSPATNGTTAKPTEATQPLSTTKASEKTISTVSVSASVTSPVASQTLSKTSGFDLGSFIGGIVLTLGLLATVYFGCRFYNSRRGVRYRTIDEHEAII